MKKILRPRFFPGFLAVTLLFFTTSILGQDEINKTTKSLSSFSGLIGGEWHFGNSYQVFEWGVGKLSVKSSSYFIIDGKPELVSEGMWLWHPGKKQIKGYFTAVNMPADFFEYTTIFQGKNMINGLTTFSSSGNREDYSEIWEFTDDQTYKWMLFQKKDDGEELIMEGIYSRKIKND